MPFYLVTFRSLVEADSDEQAALKVRENLESESKLAFEVKLDEFTTTHVVLAARTTDSRILVGIEESQSAGQREVPMECLQSTMPSHELRIQTAPSKVLTKDPKKRTAALVAIFLAGLTITTLLLSAW